MEAQIKFVLNDEIVECFENPALTLLDFIRKHKKLTGTKEVCREGDCGACAVIKGEINENKIIYKLINSCIYPIGNVNAKHIVTIEGLNQSEFTPIQQAFIDEAASQCGFCTPGFITALTCYLLSEEQYNYNTAVDAIAGNICRCTGYMSIRRSVNNLIDSVNANWSHKLSRIDNLVGLKIVPEYFRGIQNKLMEISTDVVKTIRLNEGKRIICGGTDLFVQHPDDLTDSENEYVSDSIASEITETETEIHIGANVSFEQFNRSDIIGLYFPGLHEYMHLIASLPIRNAASIAGNIVNASPIGDLSIFLLGINAKLILVNNKRQREINLKDFYKGYKSLDKSDDEYISKIIINKPSENFYFNFEKVSKRQHLDIATVNSAMSMTIEDEIVKEAHLSFGGVAPVPLYMAKLSKDILGRKIEPGLLQYVVDDSQNELAPISDIRGSKEYKSLLVKQIIKKHFNVLFPEVFTAEVIT
ncbi:MAG: FAD binding domain-containing protein [Melioribacteraceae bacterium]|nr:FAD binding domain-containing protein [Melioribacteraceae bacterium]